MNQKKCFSMMELTKQIKKWLNSQPKRYFLRKDYLLKRKMIFLVNISTIHKCTLCSVCLTYINTKEFCKESDVRLETTLYHSLTLQKSTKHSSQKPKYQTTSNTIRLYFYLDTNIILTIYLFSWSRNM